MSDVPPAAPLDLDRFSEALRRWVYDRVARMQFGRPNGSESYGPEEAGLQVVFFGGRWFAVWTDPEEQPGVPVRLRFQIVRILASADDPAEIELHAV